MDSPNKKRLFKEDNVLKVRIHAVNVNTRTKPTCHILHLAHHKSRLVSFPREQSWKYT